MSQEKLPRTFTAHAADVLGNTNSGLSGNNIVKRLRAYAADFGVTIPHPVYPFEAGNKATALRENLEAFSGFEQHRIIRELCDDPTLPPGPNEHRAKLRIDLATKYKAFDNTVDDPHFFFDAVEETRHWLDDYPQILKLYDAGISKYKAGVFERNVLDDMRLSLETLLKELLVNNKSMENQQQYLGSYIKIRGGSKELTNMFLKLTEYYSSYQNSYVKHSDSIIVQEVEFIIEISSSFMKYLIKLVHLPARD